MTEVLDQLNIAHREVVKALRTEGLPEECRQELAYAKARLSAAYREAIRIKSNQENDRL